MTRGLRLVNYPVRLPRLLPLCTPLWMDGLLNTCHASLINIQSSPSRKSLLHPAPPHSSVERGEAAARWKVV